MKQTIRTNKIEGALSMVQKALGESSKHSFRSELALSLMETSLDALANMGLLSKVAVVVDGYDDANHHIVQKYLLDATFDEVDIDQDCQRQRIKRSRLVEDE